MVTVTESSATNTCLLCGADVDPASVLFDAAKTRVPYCDDCLTHFDKERNERQEA